MSRHLAIAHLKYISRYASRDVILCKRTNNKQTINKNRNKKKTNREIRWETKLKISLFIATLLCLPLHQLLMKMNALQMAIYNLQKEQNKLCPLHCAAPQANLPPPPTTHSPHAAAGQTDRQTDSSSCWSALAQCQLNTYPSLCSCCCCYCCCFVSVRYILPRRRGHLQLAVVIAVACNARVRASERAGIWKIRLLGHDSVRLAKRHTKATASRFVFRIASWRCVDL